uniref:Uncharacterized protein n=1 Tax=Knipowitschia caucasica TaxID=637954 RepID=A0AAV2JE24_KNICA
MLMVMDAGKRRVWTTDADLPRSALVSVPIGQTAEALAVRAAGVYTWPSLVVSSRAGLSLGPLTSAAPPCPGPGHIKPMAAHTALFLELPYADDGFVNC